MSEPRRESVERLRCRINDAADARESRRSSPLGAGYYTMRHRERAVALASSMLAAAEEHGVSLDDLNGVTDLAVAALDAIGAADHHRRFLDQAGC